MRVCFEWLKEFVDLSVPVADLAHRLTMAGLEVEGMEQTPDGDTVLEVNVTPNRPDCLSIVGVAREAAAAYGLPLRIPAADISGQLPPSEISVEIADPALCNRYTGRSIKGVKIGPTPDWMRRRIEKCGVRALNNNIVDITNYVLLEFGHPLHAFDSDKLFDGIIRVARAGSGRTIRTLDGIDRELPEESLLIWDGKQPVAVAGVMGGEGSSVGDETANIFLESAYFEPTSVRRTSKTLGLRSESSYRFERGTDIEYLVNALNRAALLMRETGGGTIHDIVDLYPVPYSPAKVRVSYRKVNTLLGVDLARKDVLEVLSRIGLNPEDAGEDFIVQPPPFRRDVTEYFDVIEEVARVYGFDRIPAKVLKTPLPDGILNVARRKVASIKEAVLRSGYTEIVNFSFMNPADLDMFSLSPEDERRKAVSVKNPLRQEEALMRTTLAPALVNNFLYNVSRGVRDIRIFELARVFIDGGGQLPNEKLRLAGLFYQEPGPALWKDEAPAFFRVKGGLEALFEDLKIRGITYGRSEEPFLHRGKSSDILCDGRKLGYLGEIGPSLIERLDLKMQKPQIVLFELDLDAVLDLAEGRVIYNQIAKFPSIDRDVALVIDDDITAADVAGHFRSYPSEFIEDVQLFDQYKGKNIPQGKKSLAFRIIYRSPERTLTDGEVEPVHKELVDYVLQQTGGQLRV